MYSQRGINALEARILTDRANSSDGGDFEELLTDIREIAEDGGDALFLKRGEYPEEDFKVALLNIKELRDIGYVVETDYYRDGDTINSVTISW